MTTTATTTPQVPLSKHVQHNPEFRKNLKQFAPVESLDIANEEARVDHTRGRLVQALQSYCTNKRLSMLAAKVYGYATAGREWAVSRIVEATEPAQSRVGDGLTVAVQINLLAGGGQAIGGRLAGDSQAIGGNGQVVTAKMVSKADVDAPTLAVKPLE